MAKSAWLFERVTQCIKDWRMPVWTASLAATCAVALIGVPSAGGVLSAPTAYANEGGDFVINWALPANTIYKSPESHSSYIELESWNTGDMGHGSCVGVAGGGEACSVSNLGKDYDEAYCRSSCNGDSGKEFISNPNSFEGHYTGWAYWR